VIEFIRELWNFHVWTAVAVLAAMTALVSILADRRRQRRAVLEAVGFMPWTGISVMATLVTVVSIALALKQG
jgi:ABC-type sugar transport system permease subunit